MSPFQSSTRSQPCNPRPSSRPCLSYFPKGLPPAGSVSRTASRAFYLRGGRRELTSCCDHHRTGGWRRIALTRLMLDHVDVSEYAAPRDRPAIRKNRDDAAIESMMEPKSTRVVAKSIGEQRERKLRPAIVAFSAAEARRKMNAEVEPRIEGSPYSTFADNHSALMLARIKHLSHKRPPCRRTSPASESLHDTFSAAQS